MITAFLDTNILLRFLILSHAARPMVRRAVHTLWRRHDELLITPQNCGEFWNAATRPVPQNGFGLTPAQAHRLLRRAERLWNGRALVSP